MRTSSSVFPLLLVLLPALASCWAGPQPPVIWTATSADTTALKADLSKFDNGLKEAHPTAINAIVGEARKVLASPEFQGALVNITAMDIGVKGSSLDGVQVAQTLLGMEPTRPGLPITFASPGDPARSCAGGGSETGHTTFGGGQASICLQSVTLKRAVGNSVEERACAVNTIVHEWTHTIPDPKSEPSKPDSFFQDGGHTDSQDPLVSYTVGALAQCIYLTTHELSDELDPIGEVYQGSRNDHPYQERLRKRLGREFHQGHTRESRRVTGVSGRDARRRMQPGGDHGLRRT